MAILSSSGLSWVPRLGTGMADNQEPDSGWAEATNRALEYWFASLSRVFWRKSIRGASQALCLKRESPSGSEAPWGFNFQLSNSEVTSNGAKPVVDWRIAPTMSCTERAEEI